MRQHFCVVIEKMALVEMNFFQIGQIHSICEDNPLHLCVGMLYWIVMCILVCICVDRVCQSGIWQRRSCRQFLNDSGEDFQT